MEKHQSREIISSLLDSFITKNNNKLNSNLYSILPFEFIVSLKDEKILDWDRITEYCDIPIEYLEEYKDYINWDLFWKQNILSKYNTKDVFDLCNNSNHEDNCYYFTKINWDSISVNNPIEYYEHFWVKFDNYINWNLVCTSYRSAGQLYSILPKLDITKYVDVDLVMEYWKNKDYVPMAINRLLKEFGKEL